MNDHRPRGASGKWIVGTIVALGLLAGIVEWKFRFTRPSARPPATLPR